MSTPDPTSTLPSKAQQRVLEALMKEEPCRYILPITRRTLRRRGWITATRQADGTMHIEITEAGRLAIADPRLAPREP